MFQYVQGYNDSGSIVATMVYTGAVGPGWALILVAFFVSIGALFLGTAVALTFIRGIIEPEHLDLVVIWSALISALLWTLVAGIRGIPTSSTHAIIGGLVGPVLFSAGPYALNWVFIVEILLALLIAPFLGLLFGYLLTNGSLRLFGAQSPHKVRRFFERSQIFSSSAIALAYGTNDAQKTMGILTLGLIIMYRLYPHEISFLYSGGSDLYVPIWVRIACAAAVSLGILTGGYRTMKTVGSKIYRVRSVHGFSAQLASAAIVYSSAIFGLPMSTTQVISSSIVGAGAAQRISAIKWNVVNRIMSTWIITLPCTAVLSGVVYTAIKEIHVFL
ncbi:MAG: inorganic phosphate transporter [Deltaproteobacteria bacterium]|nr:inorganic phosphate transporter [Candidatus Zymogenaceae bacterium]